MAVRFSSRTRQASHRQIQWLQTALKFWKVCCLHLYNRGKFARTLSGKIRRPEKSLCHVGKGWEKTQGRPRPHLRNIVRMWTVWRSFVSPNAGWKVLLWWMAQLNFAEIKGQNFSFIVYILTISIIMQSCCENDCMLVVYRFTCWPLFTDEHNRFTSLFSFIYCL